MSRKPDHAPPSSQHLIQYSLRTSRRRRALSSTVNTFPGTQQAPQSLVNRLLNRNGTSEGTERRGSLGSLFGRKTRSHDADTGRQGVSVSGTSLPLPGARGGFGESARVGRRDVNSHEYRRENASSSLFSIEETDKETEHGGGHRDAGHGMASQPLARERATQEHLQVGSNSRMVAALRELETSENNWEVGSLLRMVRSDRGEESPPPDEGNRSKEKAKGKELDDKKQQPEDGSQSPNIDTVYRVRKLDPNIDSNPEIGLAEDGSFIDVRGSQGGVETVLRTRKLGPSLPRKGQHRNYANEQGTVGPEQKGVEQSADHQFEALPQDIEAFFPVESPTSLEPGPSTRLNGPSSPDVHVEYPRESLLGFERDVEPSTGRLWPPLTPNTPTMSRYGPMLFHLDDLEIDTDVSYPPSPPLSSPTLNAMGRKEDDSPQSSRTLNAQVGQLHASSSSQNPLSNPHDHSREASVMPDIMDRLAQLAKQHDEEVRELSNLASLDGANDADFSWDDAIVLLDNRDSPTGGMRRNDMFLSLSSLGMDSSTIQRLRNDDENYPFKDNRLDILSSFTSTEPPSSLTKPDALQTATKELSDTADATLSLLAHFRSQDPTGPFALVNTETELSALESVKKYTHLLLTLLQYNAIAPSTREVAQADIIANIGVSAVNRAVQRGAEIEIVRGELKARWDVARERHEAERQGLRMRRRGIVKKISLATNADERLTAEADASNKRVGEEGEFFLQEELETTDLHIRMLHKRIFEECAHGYLRELLQASWPEVQEKLDDIEALYVLFTAQRKMLSPLIREQDETLAVLERHDSIVGSALAEIAGVEAHVDVVGALVEVAEEACEEVVRCMERVGLGVQLAETSGDVFVAEAGELMLRTWDELATVKESCGMTMEDLEYVDEALRRVDRGLVEDFEGLAEADSVTIGVFG
ncbi:hypothetical protein K402DRAFT_425360 [Aulographum hederae CBS 113979]|uniref:Uncharacterized protein n=1 Tax=Aulographum hederae CBS 113979 TaxID=1176131 RepID=A0A6G1GKL3_9PEZI|nr:hypothetical protein K402DRAFT_425360 [Aulographum hederae CBS 113979]